MRIFFVGIHNKPNTPPLDSKTKSGKLIDKIIINLGEHSCIKTNLFDCDYIPKENIEKYNQIWADKHRPSSRDVIILLGNNVNKLFSSNVQSKLIKIRHPSSIWSKQSQEEYVKDVLRKIADNK